MKKARTGILIVVLLIIMGALLGKNAIIKRTLEENLTASLETPVRIDTATYSLLGKKLSINGLKVESKENSSTNIVVIGNISTKINYKKIFDKEINTKLTTLCEEELENHAVLKKEKLAELKSTLSNLEIRKGEIETAITNNGNIDNQILEENNIHQSNLAT